MAKKRAFSLLMALCLLFSLSAAATWDGSEDFTPRPGSNVDAIDPGTPFNFEKELVEIGLIGDEAIINPTGTLTRAEAAKIVAYTAIGPDALDKLNVADTGFKDVPVAN